jgi:hypothetical protein
MARLLVFVNTEEMTGKSSFLIVEKSRTGNIIGKLRSEASTILWVGDSMARFMIGRMSKTVRDIRSDILSFKLTVFELLPRAIASYLTNVL